MLNKNYQCPNILKEAEVFLQQLALVLAIVNAPKSVLTLIKLISWGNFLRSA